MEDSIAQFYTQQDSTERQKEIKRNLDELIQLDKDRKKDQKRIAIIKIIIGAGFLLILIFGLLRRSKTKKESGV